VSLPSTTALREALNAVVDPSTDCDGIVGPALRVVGILFSMEASSSRSQNELAEFIDDTKSSIENLSENQDLREQLFGEFEKLNALDEAYSNQSIQSILGSSDPYSQAGVSPDSLLVNQQTGGFGLFDQSSLINNQFSDFTLTGSQIDAPSGGTDCSDLLAGSFGSPTAAELPTTTRSFRRAASSLAGIGMSITQNPGRLLSSSITAMSTLLTTLGQRRATLENCKTQISNIRDLLEQLDSNDYVVRVNQVITGAKVYVTQAIEAIEQIVDELTASGDVNEDRKDELKEFLLEARRELDTPPVPAANNFFVYQAVSALLVVLNQLVEYLKNQNNAAVPVITNLTEFRASLESNITVSNHFGSMFSILRCRLQKLSAQMTRVIQKSNPVIAHLKMQEWRILLEVYRKMVDLAAKDPAPQLVGEFTSSFGESLGEFEDSLSSLAPDFSEEEIDQSPSKIRAFMDAAQTKLKTDLDQSVIDALAGDAIEQIDKDLENSTIIENLMDEFIDSNPSQQKAAEALSVVLASSVELFPLSDALSQGDWKQFFTADPQDLAIEAVTARLLEAAANCRCGSQTDAAAQSVARRLRREADRRIQQDRLNQLDERYVSSTSSEVTRSAILEIRVLKQRLRSLRALFQSPCFGVTEQVTLF